MIERAFNEDEKKEITSLKEINHEKVFKHKLDEHEQKCTINKTPFCRRCSKVKYERLIRDKTLDLNERGIAPLSTHKDFINIARTFDFEQYTGKDHFDIHSISKCEEPIIIDLNRVNKHMANMVNLVCKKYPTHRLSIRIDLKEWDEWETKYITKKEKKAISIPSANAPSAN